MHCLVTAGPTVEPIDEVRRLTNHSTGRLGCGLADALNRAGHRVTLLLSSSALHLPRSNRIRVIRFSTTRELGEHLRGTAKLKIRAIFHAAAISDFCVMNPRKGKISSAKGITIKLKPTPKLIRNLRKTNSDAFIVGWKYEVSGNRKSAVDLARQQVNQCKTNLCVANGPAYGDGFGVVGDEGIHCADDRSLFRFLIKQITSPH